MVEPVFFMLGLANNLLLIAIFAIRERSLERLQKIGWVYLLPAVPAIYTIVLTRDPPRT